MKGVIYARYSFGNQRDVEHRQRLVDSFINAIYLYDDKLVLIFNDKDSSKNRFSQ